jgi:acyl-CoA reductase-like NAD-dependent aldehyde dehydrogenase
MEMYIAGNWTGSAESIPVISPYNGETFDEVPSASADQVEKVLAAAVDGAAQMRALTAYDRCNILNRAADLIAAQVDDLARTVTMEMGKPLPEATGEVSRMADLFRLCAFEGSQIRGESLPIDAQSGAAGKLGFTLREPCGIVLAITPFNYPVLLAVHKIGPALAAGNAVILKPASATPVSALKLTKILIEAGLPENGLQCITGSGSSVGMKLCSDERIRKISFTGSSSVGEAITKIAGVKKLSLELGSNAPVVILPDADIEQVADATTIGGFVNAGQVCISTQRVIASREVYADLIDALKPRVEALKTGDPLKEGTRISAMVSEKEAVRVEEWVNEACSNGARLVTGGSRDKAVYQPTIVADVDPSMKISCQELFGPAVAVTPVDSIDEAIAVANDSSYGLGAGIFTRDINNAMRFAREAQSGNVMINWTPLWRADFMPYGGIKQSGFGKEGPRYAIEEMTEIKTVVIHGVG